MAVSSGTALNRLSLREIEEKIADPSVPVSAQLLRRLQRDSRSGARRLYRTLQKRREDNQRERQRLAAMLHFERVLWKAGIQRIAGVDEVGVGPLAGPVVAAAVVFPPDSEIAGVDDSKALDEEVRSQLDCRIRASAVVAIGLVEVDEIDRINIYHAGLKAMRIAVDSLPEAPQHVLVDSRTIPGIVLPQNSFDKGDGINFSIAAASIVAKVYRDRLMVEMDARYPGYGFASHKGYATPEHQAAIREKGPCVLHRRSFDYIRELCGQYCAAYYELKAEAARVSSRPLLAKWERSLRSVSPQLSEMENRKLNLLKNRLWKRVADSRSA